MQRDVAVSRSDAGLAQAADALESLAAIVEGESADSSDLELRNLTTVATLITHAAWLRTESRGCHWRTDFPERDDVDWLGRIVMRRGRMPRVVPVHPDEHAVVPSEVPNRLDTTD